jgi:hypothetical protein
MPMIASTETQVIQNPQKFAMAEPKKLVTFLKGEPPHNAGRGRRRNPVISAIYNELIQNRNVWAHVNIPITDKKVKSSVISSLYARAAKDNLALSTSSVFNERTKMYDLWVMVSSK